MNRIYILGLLLLISVTSFGQVINFPDPNFKQTLLNANPGNNIAKDQNGNNIAIDINGDNEIDQSEALVVYQLRRGSLSLTDITGIEFFTNLTYLNLNSTSSNPSNLGSADLTSLVNLEEVEIRNNPLLSIDVAGLSNLRILFISNNILQSLDVSSNPSLEFLDCGENEITNLDISGLTNITELYCAWNNIPTLDVSLLSNLQVLRCEQNELADLTFGNSPMLTDVRCWSNNLNTLDVTGLTNLNYLRLDFNNVVDLDVSMLANLESLFCTFNNMTSLNVAGLSSLERLYAGDNALTSIDLSGLTSLRELAIRFNSIDEIDLSGMSTLEIIDLEMNSLEEIEVPFAPNLDYLSLLNNELVYINFKNSISEEMLSTFSFYQNPMLEFVCADSEDLDYIQDVLNSYSYFDCALSTYCSFVPGGEFFLVEGEINYDLNNNNCVSGSSPIPQFNLSIDNGVVDGTITSNSSGFYSIPVQAGTHTISPSFENPTYFTAQPPFIDVSFPNDPNPFIQDFCISANGIFPDLEVEIIPVTVARPGFEAEYKVIYRNKGTAVQSGEVRLEYSENLMDYVSSIPIFDEQNFNEFVWFYEDLEPFETREINLVFEINAPTDSPPVNVGDILFFDSSIEPIASDETPEDNAFQLVQTVVGALDPNDKVCLQGETVSPEFIGEYVHYLIRFENLGTFAAENVVVRDEIDTEKFDLSTLQVLSASHQFVTRVNTNIVEFIFEDINLPFNDEDNDGYVAFKIKTRPDLEVGDQFSNEAAIYFDFNLPVITNQYVTVIEEPLGTDEFSFRPQLIIYPNPATGLLYISINDDVIIRSASIYDMAGRVVLSTGQIDNGIDVSVLNQGTYLMEIESDKGTYFYKVLKE